jgi:eukaryotic-like serine/threonine-protein kinase
MACSTCGSATAGPCPNCGNPLADAATIALAIAPDDATTLPSHSAFTLSATDEDETRPDNTAREAPTAPLVTFGQRGRARPSTPLAVGQEFGRYHIIKVLGVGGMGAVYQAWDGELGMAVALKVIRPEATSDPAVAAEMERRFKQELVLARRVTHKNVVRIHDLGELDGIKYITMPDLEGSDLATVLRERKTLPVPEALRLLRDVAEGLQAAHEVGIVHRDLKPANIMVLSDRAVIMDFGIARLESTASTALAAPVGAPAQITAALADDMTRATATMAGAVVGTVEYMAPEQARGQEVDQRVDIYAFGLILYDVLLGRHRAERAGSAVADLQARLQQAPAALKTVLADIPEPLNRFVARCVEPDRGKRFTTTAEMVAALAQLDENGRLRPRKRVVRLPVAAAVAAALLGLSGYIWWQTRPPVVHDPVSVVIADLRNNTGDATFDRTLEPMLRRALEAASFITAFDRSRVGGLGVRPPERLDEAAARAIAAKQGVGVVLTGAVDRQGEGYVVSVKATRTLTEEVIADEQERAPGRDQILDAATRLVIQVRNALGDDESESAQQFAMASISATSIDVARLYAAAVEASARNRFEEARNNALEAVRRDPNFGLGYLIASAQSRNMGRVEDGKRYMEEALRHLDGMTDRERYHTRGSSYLATNDYDQCVKEFGDAIAKYPADVAGRNQLALCLSHQRQMTRAVQVMQEVVKILPSQPVFRDNLALYANYAGDFATAEREAQVLDGPDAYAMLALAFSQLGQGRIADAKQTYERLKQVPRLGATFAASGLSDVAALEGRFADAISILRDAVAADLKAGNVDAASAKLTAIAHAELSRGRPGAAVAAAEESLKHGASVRTRFLAARTFAEAGEERRARPLIDGLANELYAEPQAYAKIADGVLALRKGDARRALVLLREANRLFDTWIGQFDLGRASLEVGLFAQADSAFDACLNARRGEALSLFVDEEPTYAYLAPVYYYLGRAREGLKSPSYADSYRDYLTLRGGSTEDPRLAEVRRRTGS